MINLLTDWVICSLIDRLIDWSIDWLICWFIRWFIRSIIRSFIRSFIYWYVHSIIHSFIHSLNDCVERERQLRKKPIPTRFRNDNNWELYIHNFPDDTTEVVIRSQYFIFDTVFSLGFQFCRRMYCTLHFEGLVKSSTTQLSIRFTGTFRGNCWFEPKVNFLEHHCDFGLSHCSMVLVLAYFDIYSK